MISMKSAIHIVVHYLNILLHIISGGDNLITELMDKRILSPELFILMMWGQYDIFV